MSRCRSLAPALALAMLTGCGGHCIYPGPDASSHAAAAPLFDGATLGGWVQRGGDAVYAVEDGCIVGRTAPNQPNSFLCTKSEHGDFILTLEFRVDPELNSGVQIRSQSRPEGQRERVYGYQVEIDPSDRAWTGGIYDEGRRGWLDDLSDAPNARAAFRQNEWNALKVEATGDRIRTWINGIPAADLRDAMTPSGFIALQVHGVGKRSDPLEVRWRKIVLTPLSAGVTAPPSPAEPDRAPAQPASR